MNAVSTVHNKKANKAFSGIEFVPNKYPWAVYLASSYDSASNTILDSSINNRPAAVTTNLSYISDSSFRQSVLAGTTASTILFPTGSLPVNYTIGSVTRYTLGGTKRRVLSSSNVNFTHCHYEGYNSLFYNNSTTMSPFNTNYGSSSKWCVAVSTNSANIATPYNCILNGQYIGTGIKLPDGASYQLSINLSHYYLGRLLTTYSEQSDFQFYALVIYDQALTLSEMALLNSNLSLNIV